jgi:hypothetical protein
MQIAPEEERRPPADLMRPNWGDFALFVDARPMQVDELLQAKLDASDGAADALEAHGAIDQFRWCGNGGLARRIMARNLADEFRKFRRDKRNVQWEASLQAVFDESTVPVRLRKFAERPPSPTSSSSTTPSSACPRISGVRSNHLLGTQRRHVAKLCRRWQWRDCCARARGSMSDANKSEVIDGCTPSDLKITIRGTMIH